MKKLLCIFCMLFLICAFPLCVSAEDAHSGQCGENAFWTYDESTKTIEISGSGPMENYDPPHPMPHPDNNTNPWQELVFEKVIVKSGITTIGDYTFNDFPVLKEVILPEGLEAIGNMAFCSNPALQKINLPSSLKSLGDGVFSDCVKLTLSTIPEGIEKINWFTFDGCSAITEFTVPKSVKHIGMQAFIGCDNLKLIRILNPDCEVYEEIEFDRSNVFPSQAYICSEVGGNVQKYTGRWGYTFTELSTPYETDFPENVKYFVNRDDRNDVKLTVTECKNDEFFFVHFPDTINYIPVTHINCANTLELRNTLAAYIPASVKVIKAGTFSRSEQIKSIYFSGTKEQWDKIEIEEDNDDLNTVKFYFNSKGPKEDTNHQHNYSVEVLKYSSCSEEGQRKLTCYCGYVTTEAIEKNNHYAKAVKGKAPTCTEKGLSDGEICDECGAVIKAQEELPAKGHTEETVSAVEPDCTTPGLTEGKICKVCNAVLVPQAERPALGHKLKDTDCIYVKECTVCGIKESNGNIHTHEKITTPPTCIAEGYTLNNCSCGPSYTTDIIPATGHKWTTEKGKKICSVCKEEVALPSEPATQPTTVPTTQPTTAPTTQPTTLIPSTEPTSSVPTTAPVTQAPVVTEAPSTEPETRPAENTTAVPSTEEATTVHTHKEAIIPAVSATYTADGKTEGKICSECGEILEKQKKTSRKILKKVKNVKVSSVKTDVIKITWKKVEGAEKYKVLYSTDGKKWKTEISTDNIQTVKKLKDGTSYRFKVKASAGKYEGAASAVLKTSTKVKKAVLKSVKSPKKSQALLKWDKVRGADGFVIEYSTSKKFTKKTTKAVTIKKGKTTKTTLKKLKSGKKYYVRIKAYRTVNKKAVYGAYSKAKTVIVK